jgi:hypothetical protein
MLVAYLEPGRYFGIDLRHESLDAGYEGERDRASWARTTPASA